MPKSSLENRFAKVLQSEDLRPEERAFLKRLVADPGANGTCSKIEAAFHEKHGELGAGLSGIFVYEVLAALACYATDARAFRKQAENAESLATFLRGPASGRGPPLLPKSEVLISSLEDAAEQLRQLAANQTAAGLKQVSRIDRNGSRARVTFMRSVSELLMGFCGRPLDEAVLFLTGCAFPDDEIFLDQVISARRPTTRTGRRSKPPG